MIIKFPLLQSNTAVSGGWGWLLANTQISDNFINGTEKCHQTRRSLPYRHNHGNNFFPLQVRRNISTDLKYSLITALDRDQLKRRLKNLRLQTYVYQKNFKLTWNHQTKILLKTYRQSRCRVYPS